MKILSKIAGLFKKKPAKPVQQPIPGYDYWQYREDVFNPQLTFDEIMIRCNGKIPRPPRNPEIGETWEYVGCKKHGAPAYSYPVRMMVTQDLKRVAPSFMAFVICGCFIPVEDKKVEA